MYFFIEKCKGKNVEKLHFSTNCKMKCMNNIKY